MLLGRFVGILRALVPAVAGDSRMPYSKFLLWNVVGAVIWGPSVVVAGYLAGRSWRVIETYLSRGGLALFVLIVLGFVAAHFLHKRRTERRTPEARSTGPACCALAELPGVVGAHRLVGRAPPPERSSSPARAGAGSTLNSIPGSTAVNVRMPAHPSDSSRRVDSSAPRDGGARGASVEAERGLVQLTAPAASASHIACSGVDVTSTTSGSSGKCSSGP